MSEQLQTISIASVPPTLLNSQGSILDPVQIKKSSAAKMRLADKTGNVALRKEAAAEQSFADRLGGRTALLSDELKAQIQQQKLAQAQAASETTSPSTTSPTPVSTESTTPAPAQDAQQSEQKKGRKRGNKQEQTAPQETQEQTPVPRQHQPLKPTSEPFTPQKQVQVQPAEQNVATFVPQITLPPEAIILKLDAASKQSIADKTGNLVLKRTAALEQSLADKMAFVSAPGITTTALRAGRKGFMLDPNFQLQTNAIVTAAVNKAVPQQQPQQPQPQPTQPQPQQAQQPKQQKQPKQKKQPEQQPAQPQPQKIKENEGMIRSSSFGGFKQQNNETMTRSKSFKQPKPTEDQPFYLKPKITEQQAPQRSDNLNWRVKDETETMVRSSSFSGFKKPNNDSMVRSSSFATQKRTQETQTQTSPDASPRTVSPISSSSGKYIPPNKLQQMNNGDAQTMMRSKSFSAKRDGYRAKNNKGDDTPAVDLEKLKDGASVVEVRPPAMDPLTPATACM